MDRTEKLRNEKIGKLLFSFSLPGMIGMGVMASYSLIDRYFIGNVVGTLGISAIHISMPIIMVFFAFGMLLGFGASSAVSLKLGEGKKKEAELILGNVFSLSLILSTIVTGILYIFLDPLLISFGAQGTVLEYARTFLKISLVGGVFQSIAWSLNNVIRAEGNPKTAMITMIISALINIVLNPLFIVIFKLGMAGSALATVIAQLVSLIWIFAYFLQKRSHLHFHYSNFKLKYEIVAQIMKIGFPFFVMHIAGAITISVANKALTMYGGDTAIAVLGIISPIAMFIMMPIFGINQGMQPIIGFNYGAKQFDRVKSTLRLSIFAAVSIGIIGLLVVDIFGREMISKFCDNDHALIEMGTHAIRIYLIMLPVIGFQVVSSVYFQAVGKPTQTLILTLTRQIIFVLPLMLILPQFFHTDGIWYSAPIADFCSSVLTGILLYIEVKQLDKKHNAQQDISTTLAMNTDF
ncbi:MAG: MATE family efflux transporter [Candidatus Kapabacteria bacterium]|nr:MATE family efflux transporter [Candidatus Kapabacteria bacterium]